MYPVLSTLVFVISESVLQQLWIHRWQISLKSIVLLYARVLAVWHHNRYAAVSASIIFVVSRFIAYKSRNAMEAARVYGHLELAMILPNSVLTTAKVKYERSHQVAKTECIGSGRKPRVERLLSREEKACATTMMSCRYLVCQDTSMSVRPRVILARVAKVNCFSVYTPFRIRRGMTFIYETPSPS